MQQWFDRVMQTEGLEFKITVSILIILVLYLIRSSILRLVVKWEDDPKALYNWRKSTGYSSFILGLILLFYLWFERFQSVGTILGLFSAGLVIAMRDPLVNLAGFVFIVARRPFHVGDRIQIGDFRGDVIDIRIFQFTLNEIGNWVQADQSTGRIIHIPNGKVFVEMQANYSRGFKFIWNEIPVTITFESNWRKAKQILQDVVDANTKDLSQAAEARLKEAAQNFMIYYKKLTPIVYTSVKDHGVCLTIRYLCNPRQRRGSEELIWENILSEFEKNKDIEFAYPTQRFYDRKKENPEPPDIL